MSTPTVRQYVAGATADGAGVTVTLGAGTASGDLLVIFHCNDYSTAALLPNPTSSQTLSGLTLRATGDQGTNTAHVKCWTALTTVGGSQTVTGAAEGFEEVTVHVVVIDGSTINSSDFMDGAAGSQGPGSNSHVAPSVSPSTTDALLFCAAGSSSSSGSQTYTAPGGMTERTDVSDGLYGCVGSVASQILAASGATGTKTFTCSAFTDFATASIAIKGGSGGGGPAVEPTVPIVRPNAAVTRAAVW